MGAPYRHMELHQQAMEQEAMVREEKIGRQYAPISKPCDYCKQPSTGIQCCKQCGGPRSMK